MSQIINLYVSVFSSVTKDYEKNLKGEKVNCIRKKETGADGKESFDIAYSYEIRETVPTIKIAEQPCDKTAAAINCMPG